MAHYETIDEQAYDYTLGFDADMERLFAIEARKVQAEWDAMTDEEWQAKLDAWDEEYGMRYDAQGGRY